MRHTLIIYAFVLFSCGTKTTDHNSDKSIDSVKTELDGENFNDFFDEFKSDSLFQIERVKFPLTLISWDFRADNAKTNKLEISNWRYIRFEYEDEYAYTQKTKIYDDSAKFELRGVGSVGNGALIDYNFIKLEGRWFLVSEKDFSD